MSLTRLEIKTEYRKSDKDWIIEEFLIPILKEGVSYRRAVGYFSSTALANVVPGIAGLFANKKYERCCCVFSAKGSIRAVKLF